MKTLSNKKYIFILVFSAILLPYSVFASNIYIDTSHPDFFVGDTIMLSVRVDSENENINAVEGSILLDYPTELASLIDINTAGSKFSLWPGKPLPSANNTSISFVGGSPGGLSSKDAIIFNIVLKLQKVGQITLTPDNFSIYLNDGKGTQINPRLRPLSLNISERPVEIPVKNEWQDLVKKDKTPPEFVEAIINRDPYIFNNQYFVSFFATDKDSGIAYYEIKEGSRDFVRTESPYLLQDQSLTQSIQLKAVDKAGNESVTTPKLAPTPGTSYRTYLIQTIVALVILAIVFWLWRLWAVKLKRILKNER